MLKIMKISNLKMKNKTNKKQTRNQIQYKTKLTIKKTLLMLFLKQITSLKLIQTMKLAKI